jgi:hypothetical protein
MINFWQWIESRQDARQWTEDEKACAEIAWKEAIKLYKEGLNETSLDRLNESLICPKCSSVRANNGRCYCTGGVA